MRVLFLFFLLSLSHARALSSSECGLGTYEFDARLVSG